ncbi:MAG: hypothetical protein NZV14_12425 [Bryobacteraceae bacterium]|nr:hypothetical protein [Bryobacteraceae bacterium]MDW8378959.1 hypothetical protein [Bryobacterales bacterium]
MRAGLIFCSVSAVWVALFNVGALAQSSLELFSKAPPEIDQALRERVQKFYQAHQEGKFRLADQYVSEASKDTFFEAEKRRCRKFEIVKVSYEADFTRARVVISCETEMLLPPKGLMQVTMPLASSWRVESGQWFWFVEPRGKESPFGLMKAGEGPATDLQLPKGPTPADLRKMIEVEPRELRLSPEEGLVRSLRITNHMQGVVELRLEPLNAPDLKARLDRNQLKPEESATLTIEFTPDKTRLRPAGTTEEVRFAVLPLNQQMAVRLTFLP